MIRSLYYDAQGAVRIDLPRGEMADVLTERTGLLWLDFTAEPPEACESILLHTFGFHPLAVDDALQETHVPKVDDWSDYLYVVLEAAHFNTGEADPLQALELDVFLGPNYIVTHHDRPIPAVEELWTHCQRHDRYLKNGADHLLYRLADSLVAAYMPVVEQLDDAIDLIEDEIFGRPTPATLERIFGLKRTVLRLRRVLSPQREVLNKLARDDFAVINARDRVYFRDVYDHLVRLHDINESLRDLIGGALDTYLSVINNRMNDVMKILTVITTLFMPISFVVGFFGMNFFVPATPLNVWTERPAFLLVLLATTLLPVGMYLWIRRRGWM